MFYRRDGDPSSMLTTGGRHEGVAELVADKTRRLRQGIELWRQLLWWWAKAGASRGSRSRERIGNGVGTTGMGVGAGNWELGIGRAGNGGDCGFQVPIAVAGAAQAQLEWHIFLAMARNALSTTGHRA